MSGGCWRRSDAESWRVVGESVAKLLVEVVFEDRPSSLRSDNPGRFCNPFYESVLLTLGCSRGRRSRSLRGISLVCYQQATRWDSLNDTYILADHQMVRWDSPIVSIGQCSYHHRRGYPLLAWWYCHEQYPCMMLRHPPGSSARRGRGLCRRMAFSMAMPSKHPVSTMLPVGIPRLAS